MILKMIVSEVIFTEITSGCDYIFDIDRLDPTLVVGIMKS
jgi:hypothetical protein